MKMHSVSTRHFCTIGALVSEELSYKIKVLDRVGWILPDSYLDIKNKDCGGKPFINGQAVPYDPKYHEEWVRNSNRPNKRNFDRPRNFERRKMQIRRPTVRPSNMGWPTGGPSNIGGHTGRPSNMGVQPNSGASHAGGALNMGAAPTTVSVPPDNTPSFQDWGGLPPNKMSNPPHMVAMAPDNLPCSPNTGTMAPNYMKDLKQSTGSRISCHERIYDVTNCRRLSTAALSTDSHPILRSNSLQHRFKNWQELRKDKLTASTFSAAIGFWHNARRREQLWEEKIGAREPFSGNLATCWNNIKEQEALERYVLITGNSVSFTGFQVYGKTNHEDAWLAASPDALLDKFYDLPFGGILEIKCPYFNGDMSSASPLKRLRVDYIPQAQGLMEILDRDWMDLYVWTTKGSSLFRLYRNVEYWRLIKTALSDFWWKHVQPARQLCKDTVITNPAEQLASFRPAPKHNLLGSIVHESKQIVINSELLMREIHGKLCN